MLLAGCQNKYIYSDSQPITNSHIYVFPLLICLHLW